MVSLNKVSKFYIFNFMTYNMKLYHLNLTSLMSILVDIGWWLLIYCVDRVSLKGSVCHRLGAIGLLKILGNDR